MMDVCLVVAFCLCAGMANADIPFLTNSAPAGIKLGDSAVLICNYSAIALKFGDTVRWLKDGSKVASQSVVEPAWRNAIQVTLNESVSIVNVSATSATVGGNFTCLVERTSGQQLALSTTLPVYGQPVAVSWQGANGRTLSLTGSNPKALSFDVYGFYNVSSAVSVMLGSRDVTAQFTPTVTTGGTDPVTYNVTFTSSVSFSESVGDGTLLNATVAVPMYQPISSAVTVAIAALPNISCPTTIQVTNGDNVTINCTVHSNPAATAFNWTGSGRSITGNGTSIDGILVANLLEGSNGNYITVLNIFNVSSADFGDYSLAVMNSLGKSSITVHVVPVGYDPTSSYEGIVIKSTKPSSPSGCSHQYSQWVVTVSTLAFLGFLQAL